LFSLYILLSIVCSLSLGEVLTELIRPLGPLFRQRSLLLVGPFANFLLIDNST